MGQNLSNFIPEIWSKKLSILLKDSGVMMQCVNKDYEGEIKNAGDSVNIRTYGDVTVKNYTGSIAYDELTSPMQTLLIDQKKYFAFKCDDVSKAQSDIEIMNGYLGQAKDSVDLVKDTHLLAHYANVPASNQIAGGAFTANTIYSKFVDVAKALKNANAIKKPGDGWIVINPDIEAIMIQAPEFIQANKFGENTLRDGCIGRIAGLDILVSTNLNAVSGTTYCLAGTNKAITYASQVVKVQNFEKLEGSFDEAIRGLYVYGSKLVVEDALAYLSYTP